MLQSFVRWRPPYFRKQCCSWIVHMTDLIREVVRQQQKNTRVECGTTAKDQVVLVAIARVVIFL